MKYRIPVVVFAEVEAVDEVDASHIAERTIARTFAGAGEKQPGENLITISHAERDHRWDVNVESVRNLGSALREGTIQVTAPRTVRSE